MKELTGKGMYIWQVPYCENGNVDQIIQSSVDAGLSHLMVKIADGTYAYSMNKPYLKDLVEKGHAAGLKILGWQYVYGLGEHEAYQAVKQLKELPYDGFVIDAELEYKGKPQQAKIYGSILRQNFPTMWMALSSYRFPSYHPRFPFNAFLEFVDVNMPQVYWMWADGTAAAQLKRCVDEFSSSQFIQRPVFPTGAAYKQDGWITKPDDVYAFLDAAQRLNLAGCNFWEYRFAKEVIPSLWQVISDFEWTGEPPQPPLPEEVLFNAKVTGANYLYIRTTPGGLPTGEFLERNNVIGVENFEAEEIWVKHEKGWSAMKIGDSQFITIDREENL